VLLAASFFSSALASPTSFPDARFGKKILPEKRGFSRADALNPKKVANWITEVKVDAARLVFDRAISTTDTKNFVKANPGYRYYDNIFDDKFSTAFGGAKPRDIEVENACNQAMGMYTNGDVRFFGVDDKRKHFLLTYKQLHVRKLTNLPVTIGLAQAFGLTRNPKLQNTYYMKRGATKPTDYFGNNGPWPQDDPIADAPPPNPNAPIHMLQMMWNDFAFSGVMNQGPVKDGPYWQFYMGRADAKFGENACNAAPMGDTKAFKVDPKLGKTPKKDTVDGQWEMSVDNQRAMFQGIGRKGEGGEIGYLHFYDKTGKESRGAVMCFRDPVETTFCDPAGNWTPVARCVW
jgi:hypothetical protein